MRQYQEDVENLNEVAHNRPRAQLVLGIQQENRHIRTLQQENKELRAALEEHQNALELIMSKYRNHVTRLVNTPKPDIQIVNNEQLHILAEKTEKVCEMAAVMKEAVRVDEENCNLQQEVMARLVTENKVGFGRSDGIVSCLNSFFYRDSESYLTYHRKVTLPQKSDD